jgi:hypothetical protein
MSAETLSESVILEEFKALRGEIEMRGSEQRTMERYVVLADAALYSVLVFPKPEQYGGDQTLRNLVWFLPPIIGFLALIRWRESVRMIDHLAEFLRRRQKQIHGAENGWEWFLHNEKRNKQAIAWFAPTYIVFWWIVIGGTAALACIQYMGRSGAGITTASVLFVGTSVALFLWLFSSKSNHRAAADR